MKVSYMIPARDKAEHVRQAAESLLAQTYSPMEFLFSDQGSTDGTKQILEDVARSYNGKNTVRVVSCPDTEPQGMAGLNAHLNWLNTQTDADVILVTSADDITHPQRTERVVMAFEQVDCPMVLTGMYTANAEGEAIGETGWPKESRFVTPTEFFDKYVGGSTTQAWKHDFYDKAGPLPGSVGMDIYLPFLATVLGGAFYIHEMLHFYIQHASLDNTGLEGAHRKADDAGKLQLEELMHFQVSAGIVEILKTMNRLNVESPEGVSSLYAQLLDRAFSWATVRHAMTKQHISPLPLKA